jgi:hypothetical protein
MRMTGDLSQCTARSPIDIDEGLSSDGILKGGFE